MMIKAFSLFDNPAQNDLTEAAIDKSSQRVKFCSAKRIFQSMSNEEYCSSLLVALKSNLESQSNTLKIKSLILVHYLIRKTMFEDQRLLLFAERQLNQLKNRIADQQKQYIQNNIIQFYVMYLLKFMAHQQSFIEAELSTQTSSRYFDHIFQGRKHAPQQATSQKKLVTNQNKPNSQSPLMSHINNGFQIINLINYILQSQDSFNKMGRYYIQQGELLNLFIMYLNDLTIYNDYTKKLAKILTKRVRQLRKQEVRHCFIYLTQFQKTSDRLYEFYYNRYYYSEVKNLTSLPQFLTIQNDDFDRVIKQIKRVDKQLFLTVKESKYSQVYKQNKSMQFLTQSNFDQKSIAKSKTKRAILGEVNHRNIQNMNKTNKNLKIPTKPFQQIEQNITKYIETFQDINREYI